MRPKRRRIPGVKTHRRKLKRRLKIDVNRLMRFINDNLSDFIYHDDTVTLLHYYSDLESEGFVSIDKCYGRDAKEMICNKNRIFCGSVSDLVSSKSHYDKHIYAPYQLKLKHLSSTSLLLNKYIWRMKSIERMNKNDISQ